MMKSIFLIWLCLSLIAGAQAKDFRTEYEKSGFKRSSTYSETMNYFGKLEKQSKYGKLISFGKSPQGREMKCFIISGDMAFTPQKAKSTGKPIILIQSGIHSGEIEGKDASMIFAREILIEKKKESWLDNAIIMIIPILNVDGHERVSKYNRINQIGPEEMGWRTTAQNLNLNRDYIKADAPEMQNLLKLFSAWLPDFYIDCHTTDGADFQYSALYAFEKHQNIYNKTGEWLKSKFLPSLVSFVEKDGFLIAPYFDVRQGGIEKGIYDWGSSPKLSTGYAAAQNRPALLIEAHSLKPYKTRVMVTHSILCGTLDFLSKNKEELKQLNKKADDDAVKSLYYDHMPMPVNLKTNNESEQFLFKGIKSKKEYSEITGSDVLRYTGEKSEIKTLYYNKLEFVDSVYAPKGYIIPKEWGNIIGRLKLHGVKYEVLKKGTEFEVEEIKFRNIKFAEKPYEGHHQVSYSFQSVKKKIAAEEGSYYVPTNQRAIKIILFALEPGSNESFLKWGFFNICFEQKEYFEEYSMEPVAAEMLKSNPDLKSEFEKKLKEDESFRKNPYQRLQFFYERSSYYDKKLNVYPVLRVLE